MHYCQCEEYQYQTFPSIVIGGPTGDYYVDVPVQSNRFTEYQILSIANGNAPANVLVTDIKLPQLDFTGSKTLNYDTFMTGESYSIQTGDTIIPKQIWNKVKNSQHRLYIRIDTQANNSVYVTIKFRTRLVTVIPDISKDITHHDVSHQVNLKRSERIKERLEN